MKIFEGQCNFLGRTKKKKEEGERDSIPVVPERLGGTETSRSVLPRS